MTAAYPRLPSLVQPFSFRSTEKEEGDKGPVKRNGGEESSSTCRAVTGARWRNLPPLIKGTAVNIHLSIRKVIAQKEARPGRCIFSTRCQKRREPAEVRVKFD